MSHRQIRQLPGHLFVPSQQQNGGTATVDLSLWAGTLSALRREMAAQAKQARTAAAGSDADACPVHDLFAAAAAAAPSSSPIQDISVRVGLSHRDGDDTAAVRQLDEAQVLALFLDVLHFCPQYRIRTISLAAAASPSSSPSAAPPQEHELTWSAATQRALRLALECAELRRRDCLGMLPPSSVAAAAPELAFATPSRGGGDAAVATAQTFTARAGGEPVVIFERPTSARPPAHVGSTNPSACFSPRRWAETDAAATAGDDAARRREITAERTEKVFKKFDALFLMLKQTVRSAKAQQLQKQPSAVIEEAAPAARAEVADDDEDFFGEDEDGAPAPADPAADASANGGGASTVAGGAADAAHDPSGKHVFSSKLAAAPIRIALNDPSPAVVDLLVRVLRHCSACARSVHDLPRVHALTLNNFATTAKSSPSTVLDQLLAVCPVHALKSLSLAGTALSAAHLARVTGRFLQPSRAPLLATLDLRACIVADGSSANGSAAADELCRCLEQDNYALRALDVRHNGLSEQDTLAVIRAALVHPRLQRLLVFAGNAVARGSDDAGTTSRDRTPAGAASSSWLLSSVVDKFFGGMDAFFVQQGAAGRVAVAEGDETGAERDLQELCLDVSSGVRAQLRRCLLDDPLRCEWSLAAFATPQQQLQQQQEKLNKKKRRRSSTKRRSVVLLHENDEDAAAGVSSPKSARTCTGLLCLAIAQALHRRMSNLDALIASSAAAAAASQKAGGSSNNGADPVRDWHVERQRLQADLFGNGTDGAFVLPHLSVELRGDVFSWADAVDLLQFLSGACDALIVAEDDMLRRHHGPHYQRRAHLVEPHPHLLRPLSASSRSASPPDDIAAVAEVPIAVGAARISFDQIDDLEKRPPRSGGSGNVSNSVSSTATLPYGGTVHRVGAVSSSFTTNSTSNNSNASRTSRDFDVLSSIVDCLTKDGEGNPKPQRSLAAALETLDLGAVLWNGIFSDAFEEDGDDEQAEGDRSGKRTPGAGADDDAEDEQERQALREMRRRARRKQPVLLPYLDEQIWKLMRTCPNVLHFNFFPLRPPQQHLSLLQEQQELRQQGGGGAVSPVAGGGGSTADTAAMVEALSFDVLENATVMHVSSGSASVMAMQPSAPGMMMVAGGAADLAPVRSAGMAPSRSVIKDKTPAQLRAEEAELQRRRAAADEPLFTPRGDKGEISRSWGPQSHAPVSGGEESEVQLVVAAASSNGAARSDDTGTVGGSRSATMQPGGGQQQHEQQPAVVVAATNALGVPANDNKRRRRSVVNLGQLTARFMPGGAGAGAVAQSTTPSGGSSPSAHAALVQRRMSHRRASAVPAFLLGEVEEDAGGQLMLDAGDAGSGDGMDDASSATDAARRASHFAAGDPFASGSLMLLASGGLTSSAAASQISGGGGGAYSPMPASSDDASMATAEALRQQALLKERFFAFGYRVQHLRRLQHNILAVLLSKQSNYPLHRRIVDIVCGGARHLAQDIVLEHHAASPPFLLHGGSGSGTSFASSLPGVSSFSTGTSPGRDASSPSAASLDAAMARSTSVASPGRSGGSRGVAAAIATRDDGRQAGEGADSQQPPFDGKVRLVNDDALMSVVHLLHGGGLFAAVRSVVIRLPPAGAPCAVAPHLSWGAVQHLFNCLGGCTHLHLLDVGAVAPLAQEQPWARVLLDQSVRFLESVHRRGVNSVTLKPFQLLVYPDQQQQQQQNDDGKQLVVLSSNNNNGSSRSSPFHRELYERIRSSELLRHGTPMYRALLPLAECNASVESVLRSNEGTSPQRRASTLQLQSNAAAPAPSSSSPSAGAAASPLDVLHSFAPPPHVHGVLRAHELDELLLRRWSTRASARWHSFALPHCGIGSRGVSAVCRFLAAGAEACPPLRIQRLDLKNNGARIDAAAAREIVAAIVALGLTHVDLRENELTPDGLAVFFDAVVVASAAAGGGIAESSTKTKPQKRLVIDTLRSLVLPSGRQLVQSQLDGIQAALLLARHPVLRRRVANAASAKSVVLDFTTDCGDSVFDAAVRELVLMLDANSVAHSIALDGKAKPPTVAPAAVFHLERVSVRGCHLTEKSLPLLLSLSRHAGSADWSLNRFASPRAVLSAAAELIAADSDAQRVVLLNIAGCTSDRTPQSAGGLLNALAKRAGSAQVVADGWCWDAQTQAQVAEFAAVFHGGGVIKAGGDADTTSSSSAAAAVHFSAETGALFVRAPASDAVVQQATAFLLKHCTAGASAAPVRKVAFCGGTAAAASSSSAVAAATWDAFFDALAAPHCAASLTALLLSDCGLTLDAGFRQLVDRLLSRQEHQHLSYLDLSNNGGIASTPAAATALLLEAVLSRNGSLRFIGVEGCGFAPDVVELVAQRIVAQWNGLGPHVKRDLAWIEQQLIISSAVGSAAASGTDVKPQQSVQPVAPQWFVDMFPHGMRAHFAAFDRLNRSVAKKSSPTDAPSPDAQPKKRQRGAVFLETAPSNDASGSISDMESADSVNVGNGDTVVPTGYTVCWSHGAGTDAAVAALCDSVRNAVVTATTLALPSVTEPSAAFVVPNFFGRTFHAATATAASQPGGQQPAVRQQHFPLAALDLSHCAAAGLTERSLELLHQLLVDVAAETGSASADAVAAPADSSGAASPAPASAPFGRAASAGAVLSAPLGEQPHSFTSATLCHTGSGSSQVLPSSGAAGFPHLPQSARSPDEGLSSASRLGRVSSTMQRPSSASSRSMGNPAAAVVAASSSNRGHAHSPTSAPFDHPVDAHVVAVVGGSPRRHHPFVAFNSFNDGDGGEASRNSDEPPPCASARLFPLVKHFAVDCCAGVADWSALVRICLDNRAITATACSSASGARESPMRQHAPSPPPPASDTALQQQQQQQERLRQQTEADLDFVSRANRQPPALRSLLLALRSVTAHQQDASALTARPPAATASAAAAVPAPVPDSIVYHPLISAADVLTGGAFTGGSNARILRSSAATSALALFPSSLLDAPTSAEPMTDEACFLLQKVWCDSSSQAPATLANTPRPPAQHASTAQVVHRPVPINAPFHVCHLLLPRNQITAAGCIALVDGLCALPPRLASLDLSENEIGDSASSKLVALLLHERCSLAAVNLSFNAFTDRSANVFIGCIEEMRSLPASASHAGSTGAASTALRFFDLAGCPGVLENTAHTVAVAAAIPHSGTFGDLCARVLDGTQSLSAEDLRTPSTTADIPLLLCVGVLAQGALSDMRALDFSNVALRDEDLGWMHSERAADMALSRRRRQHAVGALGDVAAAGVSSEEEDGDTNARGGGGDDDDDGDEGRPFFHDVEPEHVPMLFCELLQKLLVSAPRLCVLDVSHSKLSVQAAARLFGEVAPYVREARLGFIGAFQAYAKSNATSSSSLRGGSPASRPSSSSLSRSNRSPDQAPQQQQPFVFGTDETEFLAAVSHHAFMAPNVVKVAVGPCSENAARAALAPFAADSEVFVSLLIRGKIVLLQ